MVAIALYGHDRECSTVRDLAHALHIPAAHALGLCVALWTWALVYEDDGCLGVMHAADIARACGWCGDGDELLAALLAAGVVNEDALGGLVVHNWRLLTVDL